MVGCEEDQILTLRCILLSTGPGIDDDILVAKLRIRFGLM
jgi:hypothetical protein